VNIGRRRPTAAGNAVISLAGAVIPALVALLCIPGLVGALGAERFGLLSFVWIVFGTFAVLDFGTGRATTKYVAELLASERPEAIPALFWTASAINLAVGVTCALALFLAAPWLSAHVVKVPVALAGAATIALRITALALPWIVLGGVFRSTLEGLQRFDLSNAVQLPISALNYVAPLIVARAGGTLPWVVAAVCLSRIAAVPPLLALCRRQLPQLGHPHVERRQLGRLLRFGSWLTVSNVVGPLLLSLDRLLVGSILGAGALGLYAPVYELVTRLSLVPGSVMAALFPAFSTLTERTADEVRHAMRRSQRLLALLMLPVLILGVSFAPIILRLWLGDHHTPASVTAMQVLLVGLVVLSIGAVPFTLVQALGRPKWSAMVHLIELPVHAAITWVAVTRFGIVGAAAAWSLRAAYDAALFDAAVGRMIGRAGRAPIAPAVRVAGGMTLLAAILSMFVAAGSWRPSTLAVLGALGALAYAGVAWRWALEHAERDLVRSAVQLVPFRARPTMPRDPSPEPTRDPASTL
jgi:O-antigen/teichoic acid export membrane protein